MVLEYLSSTDEAGGKNIELPFISFENIVTATDNFSDCNMLGKGGFGKVYKVLVKSFTLKIYITWNKNSDFWMMKLSRESWKEPRK